MLKNITLSADSALLQQARRRAEIENATLNEIFRHWLEHYVDQSAAAGEYTASMARLDHVQAGGQFSREEMNERR